MTVTVEERVYLDADGQATTDDEKGQVLWATPGTEVSDEEAEKVGYEPTPKEDSGSDDEAPAKSVKAPKGTKVVEGPGGDK